MPRTPAAVRRAELVEAAIRVALAEGLEAATVRRIAAEAGVSLGTVHYCFGSKRALLEAVVESVSQPEVLVDPSQVEPGDHYGMFKAAFMAYWTESGGNRDRQRLIYELVNYLVRQDDPGPELARQMFQRAYDTVTTLIEQRLQLQNTELPISHELIARMVVALTDGVALAWIADGDDQKALEVLDAYAMTFAAALSALVPERT